MGDALINKLTEFAQKYLPYDNGDLLKEYYKTHSDYGTILYAFDSVGEITGLVRFNVIDNGKTGQILDLVIRPDWRGKGLGNHFIRRALKTFPNSKFIVFHRGRKNRSQERQIPIDSFLRHNRF